MNKKIIIPSIVLGAMFCAGAYGVGSTLASSDESGRETIIQKIAEKFDLKPEEVQVVFDENRAERQNQMQERQEERLAQAVSEGKLSESQKQLTLDKMKETQSERLQNRETFRGMTQEEKRQDRTKHREEMQKWMEENGIDHDDIMGTGVGMGAGRHNKGEFCSNK